MLPQTIFAAGRRKFATLWADLPLRSKGLVVVAIPISALLAANASFYLFQRADREADAWVDRASEADNLTQNCLAELRVAECALTGGADWQAGYGRLEKLLQDEPGPLLRLHRMRRLFQQDARQADLSALRAELLAMRRELQTMLAARVAHVTRLRAQKLVTIAADTVLGLGGGLLAILLFTSGVARGVQHLQCDAARLQQRLPMLPRLCGHDEIGSLEDSLANASFNLRQSEEERDRFFSLSVDMLCVVSLRGHFRRVNPAFAEILGHPEAALLAKSIPDFVHSEDRANAAQYLEELARGHPITYVESRFCSADGSYKWLAWSAAPYLVEGLAYAVLRDITGRKLNEQALRQSNDRLYAVLESITDAFFSVDGDWRVIYVNPVAERLWKRDRHELLGGHLWELFPEAVGGPFYRMYQQVMRTGTPGHLEDACPILHCWFEAHAYPAAEGLSVYFRDTTERRESEARIQRVLQEKEVLLREVHHRVKNNLQVIYSLLRLQAGYVQNGNLLQVLKECRERVQAMALLHDQLHRAKDLSSINLGEYIKTLAASLFCSYGVPSSQIGLNLKLEDIAVPIDTAIPCGLIVHELVSNAVRHAFPDGARGQVSLGLRAQPGHRVEITVGDDGIGFSPPTDPAITQSLGLRLIGLLATQIEAEVDRPSGNGTQYRFVFQPLNPTENK